MSRETPRWGPNPGAGAASRRTTRWGGGLAGALLLVTAGVGARDPALIAAAAIPLAYVAVGALTGVPDDVAGDLVVSREIEPSPAPPDRAVEVRLVVRNAGDRVLPDVRVVDGVPGDLAVVDGTPRHGGTLQPGEEFTVAYTVGSRRGEFEFDPVRLRARSASAEVAVTETVEPEGDRRLVGRLDVDAPPLYERAERRAGVLATDEPGRGLEFHSTREYRRGDPADRIDWRHYAKRGSLATVNYREHRSATAILVLDAREPCRVVPAPGWSSAVELSAYAATHAMTELLRASHEVGIAVIGQSHPSADGLHWVPPGTGRDQRARGLEALRVATEPDPEPADVEAARQVEEVATRAPPGGQLVLFSPVLDALPVRAVETWGAYDRLRSLFSPDVLATNTVSGQHAQVRRWCRLVRCQASGAPTVDWRRGTPLPVAMEYAFSAARADPMAGRAGGGGP